MFNRSFFSNLGPVTKNLLILNVLIWVFLAVVRGSVVQSVENYGALHYFDSTYFGIWQLVTYMFIHVDFIHLFFNMWALLMFGYAIEYAFGSKRFLFYYMVCGIGAGLIQIAVYSWMVNNAVSVLSPAEYATVMQEGGEVIRRGINFPNESMAYANALINLQSTIGASGAVYGILLAFGMLFPNQEIYLMFVPYPIKAKWVVIGYGALELLLGFGGAHDGVAHFAHLGGMLFGLALIIYWKHKYSNQGRY